ncbi:hypothetical protein M0534_07005 [Methylonatrum kenyense]|uniref:hypothetical protein n=1 Tax=Methylonatrum kenyense TaxID=455253 RepID=UPI0020C13635|nr:hypothetical protein [Methylonatrum kenyense]
MISAYVTLAVLLLGLALWRQTQPDPGHRQIAAGGWRQMRPLLVRIPIALIAGSFLAMLVPRELVASSLGDGSGLQGILLATLLGAVMPGGPMITFPIALALISAGTGTAQMVTLITAWSVLALHRVIAFELPALGWRLTGIRLLACLILAPIAGLLAMLIGAART